MTVTQVPLYIVLYENLHLLIQRNTQLKIVVSNASYLLLSIYLLFLPVVPGISLKSSLSSGLSSFDGSSPVAIKVHNINIPTKAELQQA